MLDEFKTQIIDEFVHPAYLCTLRLDYKMQCQAILDSCEMHAANRNGKMSDSKAAGLQSYIQQYRHHSALTVAANRFGVLQNFSSENQAQLLDGSTSKSLRYFLFELDKTQVMLLRSTTRQPSSGDNMLHTSFTVEDAETCIVSFVREVLTTTVIKAPPSAILAEHTQLALTGEKQSLEPSW